MYRHETSYRTTYTTSKHALALRSVKIERSGISNWKMSLSPFHFNFTRLKVLYWKKKPFYACYFCPGQVLVFGRSSWAGHTVRVRGEKNGFSFKFGLDSVHSTIVTHIILVPQMLILRWVYVTDRFRSGMHHAEFNCITLNLNYKVA